MESLCFSFKEKLLFDNFPKAPDISFSKFSGKTQYWKAIRQLCPLALRDLQQQGETANVTAAKEEGSVIGKCLIKQKKLQNISKISHCTVDQSRSQRKQIYFFFLKKAF